MHPTTASVLAFIRDYFAQYHMSPTLREIASMLSLGLSTIGRALDELEDQGYISRVRGRARTIVLRREYDNRS